MDKEAIHDKFVSIIVPVYNREQFIERCINSLRNQEYNQFEIIVVNDGSTDRSGEICDRISAEDHRIRVIHTENGGVSSARNRGIREACGEYIMFLDSDDVYEPDILKKMTKYADEETICICGIMQINKNKRKFSVYTNEPLTKKDSKYLYEYDKMGVFNCPCNKLFSKKKILENEIFFDETIHFAEDFIFNLIYCRHIKYVVFINEPLYQTINCDPNSLSKAKTLDTLNGTRAKKKSIIQYFEDNPDTPISIQAHWYHCVFVDFLRYFDKSSKSLYSIDRKFASELLDKELQDLKPYFPYMNSKAKMEYWLIRHHFFIIDRLIRTIYFKITSN